MLNPSLLSAEVVSALASRFEGDFETLSELAAKLSRLTPLEAFEAYLEWNGIIHWAETIDRVHRNIFSAEVPHVPAKAYSEIPPGFGECPVCHGTGLGRELTPHELTWATYKLSGRTHHECENCRAEGMVGSGKAKGFVPLRKGNGEPCIHEWQSHPAGRCYTVYNCPHCGSHFDIDSGD
jgi:hypothetical protein